MSASLVGSEMCIRDRGNGAPDRPNARPPRLRARPTAQGKSYVCPQGHRACLLYTSDAADDM
eukprot:11735504-Alexandrium_andersonii.AAC.1